MKKIINILINILLYIWQLPQNIGGLFVLLFTNPEKKVKMNNGNMLYIADKMSGGISLGKYSIINSYYIKNCKTDEDIKNLDVSKHEAIGHGTQSRYLGPLYLPIVGLQSIIWAWMYGTIIPYTKNGYYKFWTEKWADKLGGVVRK
jgi:hypothetical protein